MCENFYQTAELVKYCLSIYILSCSFSKWRPNKRLKRCFKNEIHRVSVQLQAASPCYKHMLHATMHVTLMHTEVLCLTVHFPLRTHKSQSLSSPSAPASPSTTQQEVGPESDRRFLPEWWVYSPSIFCVYSSQTEHLFYSNAAKHLVHRPICPTNHLNILVFESEWRFKSFHK